MWLKQTYGFLDMSFDIVKKQKYAFQKLGRIIFFSLFSCACAKKTVPLQRAKVFCYFVCEK